MRTKAGASHHIRHASTGAANPSSPSSSSSSPSSSSSSMGAAATTAAAAATTPTASAAPSIHSSYSSSSATPGGLKTHHHPSTRPLLQTKLTLVALAVVSLSMNAWLLSKNAPAVLDVNGDGVFTQADIWEWAEDVGEDWGLLANSPSSSPTSGPTQRPTRQPTPRPSESPTLKPTWTKMPTHRPSPLPTPNPAGRPSPVPTPPRPSRNPTPAPSATPTGTKAPTVTVVAPRVDPQKVTWLGRLAKNSKKRWKKSVELSSGYDEHDWWVYKGPPLVQCPTTPTGPDQFRYATADAFYSKAYASTRQRAAPRRRQRRALLEVVDEGGDEGSSSSSSSPPPPPPPPDASTTTGTTTTHLNGTEAMHAAASMLRSALAPGPRALPDPLIEAAPEASEASFSSSSSEAAKVRLDGWLVSKGGLRLDVATRVYSFMTNEYDAEYVEDLKHLTKGDMEEIISSNGLKKVAAARLLEAMGYSQAPVTSTANVSKSSGSSGSSGVEALALGGGNGTSNACQIPLPSERILPPALCNKPSSRILLLSFFTTTTKARLWKEEDGNDNTLGLKNRMCYAASRGYRYVIEVVDNSKIQDKMPIMFYKTYLVSHYLQFTDWLVWMDYDLIVKNPHNW
jgi:hypothetical protein